MPLLSRLASHRRDIRARAGLLIASLDLAGTNARPLLLVGLLVGIIGSELGDLLILNLLWQNEVENQVDKGDNGKASLHDEYDGVVEAEKGAVGAGVSEDVGEPAEILLV